MKLEFSRQIFEKKNTEMSNFVKIRPVGNDSVHKLPTAKEKSFSLKQCCQIFKAYSYSMGTGGCFPGDKAAVD